MEKNMTDKQELLENNSFKGKLLHFFKKYEGYFLGGLILSPLVLYGIGMTLGADSTFELILPLPFSFSFMAIFLLSPFSKKARVQAKKEGMMKIMYVFCFIGATLSFLFLFMLNVEDLVSSINPPSIKLTHLSAEHR